MNRVTVFHELDESEMKLLKPLFEHFSCRAGTVVLEQGAPAEYFYFVISGAVEMSFKPYDGSSITVAHVEKDGLFGWSSVIGSETYTSSAIAIEDLEAFRVHGSDLRKLCMQHPDAGKDILERLADGVVSRWKDAHKQIKALLAQGIQECQN